MGKRTENKRIRSTRFCALPKRRSPKAEAASSFAFSWRERARSQPSSQARSWSAPSASCLSPSAFQGSAKSQTKASTAGMNDSVVSRSTASGVLFTYERQPTPGQKMRKDITLRRSSSRGGFGTSSDRFGCDLTITPGVGSYDLVDSERSSLLLDSPSISKKGFTTSFRSKSPRVAPVHKNPGIPGPASYNTSVMELSHISSSNLSPAFIPSGKGRVPFPPPNKVPGPCAYSPNSDPGRSPLLRNKPSSTFESKSKRDAIFKANDFPIVGTYEVGVPKKPIGDLQWTKSAYIRFQDLGRDNKVPGPQRYFSDRNFEEYFPRNTLRSSGTYRGGYVGKQQQKSRPVLSTFGVEANRFRNSTFGRLDLRAGQPGPGSYYPDLSAISSFSPPPSRSPSPTRPPLQQRSSSRGRSPPFHRDYVL